MLYDTGIGVTRDYAAAMAWYRRAADSGSASGAFNVGVMYDAGLGTGKDPQQAAAWYAKAAAKGFGRAEYNLAMMYEAGSGVRRDAARAVRLYRLAAGHGISAAADHLARLGQPFAGGAHEGDDLAMQQFRQAQRLMLARGPAEASGAAEFFRRAAERRNALAEYDLGYCYEHGIGVAQDQAAAIGW